MKNQNNRLNFQTQHDQSQLYSSNSQIQQVPRADQFNKQDERKLRRKNKFFKITQINLGQRKYVYFLIILLVYAVIVTSLLFRQKYVSANVHQERNQQTPIDKIKENTSKSDQIKTDVQPSTSDRVKENTSKSDQIKTDVQPSTSDRVKENTSKSDQIKTDVQPSTSDRVKENTSKSDQIKTDVQPSTSDRVKENTSKSDQIKTDVQPSTSDRVKENTSKSDQIKTDVQPSTSDRVKENTSKSDQIKTDVQPSTSDRVKENTSKSDQIKTDVQPSTSDRVKENTSKSDQIKTDVQPSTSDRVKKGQQIKKLSQILFLRQASMLIDFNLIQKIKQLPFCVFISSSKDSSKDILHSLLKQNYTNYNYIIIDQELMRQQNFYAKHKLLIKSTCLKNTLIIYLNKSLVSQFFLSQLNQAHQKYNAWLTYRSNNISSQIEVVSFYYRIFQLLQQNDFNSTNKPYLQKGNFSLIALGLIQLSSLYVRNVQISKQSISPLVFNYHQIKNSKRQSYIKLFKLSQDYKISVPYQQKMYQRVKDKKFWFPSKINRKIQFRAFQREQLLYLPKNHSIYQIQKKQNEQLFEDLKQRKYQEQTNFCITVLSSNNIQNNRYKRALLSVFQQDYKNFHIVFFDDFSIDLNLQKSIEYTKQYGFPKERIVFVKNLKKKYATYNIINGAFLFCKPGQVQILFDGDDALIGTQAFSMIDKIYRHYSKIGQQKWIVYSNYKTNLQALGSSTDFTSQNMIFNASTGKRKRQRIIGALRTWRVELIQNIPIEYHQEKPGEWIHYVYDDALQYSILEQSGVKKVYYFPQLMYEYTRYSNNSDSSTAKINENKRIYEWILTLKPLNKIESLKSIKKQKNIQDIFENEKGKDFVVIDIDS